MATNNERVNLFNGFTLDLARGCLLYADRPVHLRPQSYEVLKYLVENKGHLIRKDKLIEEVWQGRAVTDGSLGKCIEEVREAQGPEARQYVRNVRGRGYIFDPGLQESSEMHVLRTEEIDVLSVVVEDDEDGDVNVLRMVDNGRHQPRIRPVDLERFKRDLSSSGRMERIAEPGRNQIAARSISDGKYPSTGARRRKQIALVVLPVLIIAAATFGYFKYFAPRSELISSIAVLPFTNASGDPNMEYLSDGIGESINNSLSQLPGLRVMSRNSVYRFKGRETDVGTAGRDLSVEAVLTGRVVLHGDDVLVSVDLVNAADNTHIWGEHYNRKLTDLVSLQSEIARDVSRKLRAQLSPADERRLAKNYTANAEAYELYLKGRYYHLKLTLPEIRKGITFYQQAIVADPTYAPAHAGFAEAYRTLAIGGWGVASKELFPQAKAAAIRALELDPDLAEAHSALGWIEFFFDWDWNAAENEFRKAIELSPNNSDAHRGYAHLFSILGRGDEAIAEGRRARELDPLSLLTNALEGQFLFYARHDDEAILRLRKSLEIEPNFWIAHNILGRIYTRQERYDEAIGEFRKAIEFAGGANEPVTQLGYVLAKSGRREQAQATLEGLKLSATKSYVPAYSFAVIHNGLGEKEEALKYLEKSFQEREVQITFIKIDTRWNEVHDDPRFQNLMQRLGFK
jgi:TolB-like protein/DNA-binding winged helix-turn-helix (wHTH) protein/Flp pilus assembly protein TadD